MTDKEKLYYLIKEYVKGNYSSRDFCNLFTIQYDTETDYDNLSNEEHQCFRELSELTARFSDHEEDLLLNVYYTEDEVKAKVADVVKRLGLIL